MIEFKDTEGEKLYVNPKAVIAIEPSTFNLRRLMDTVKSKPGQEDQTVNENGPFSDLLLTNGESITICGKPEDVYAAIDAMRICHCL